MLDFLIQNKGVSPLSDVIIFVCLLFFELLVLNVWIKFQLSMLISAFYLFSFIGFLLPLKKILCTSNCLTVCFMIFLHDPTKSGRKIIGFSVVHSFETLRNLNR